MNGRARPEKPEKPRKLTDADRIVAELHLLHLEVKGLKEAVLAVQSAEVQATINGVVKTLAEGRKKLSAAVEASTLEGV